MTWQIKAFENSEIRDIQSRFSRAVDVNQHATIRPCETDEILYTISASVCAGVTVFSNSPDASAGMMHIFSSNFHYKLGEEKVHNHAKRAWDDFAETLDKDTNYSAIIFGGFAFEGRPPIISVKDASDHFATLTGLTGTETGDQYLQLLRCGVLADDDPLQDILNDCKDSRGLIVALRGKDYEEKRSLVEAFKAYINSDSVDEFDWNLSIYASQWLAEGLRQAIEQNPSVKILHDFSGRSEPHDAFVDMVDRTITIRKSQSFDPSTFRSSGNLDRVMAINPA